MPFGFRGLYDRFTKPSAGNDAPTPAFNWSPNTAPPAVSLPSPTFSFGTTPSPSPPSLGSPVPEWSAPVSQHSPTVQTSPTSGSVFSWAPAEPNRKRKIDGPIHMSESRTDPNGNSLAMETNEVQKRMKVDVKDASCWFKTDLVGNTFVDQTSGGARQVHISGNFENKRVAHLRKFGSAEQKDAFPTVFRR